MINLLIATRNAHKVREIQAMLGSAYRYWTLERFPAAPVTVEDAATFEGNARKKALELARWLATQPALPEEGQKQPWIVLADDSGLEVDALNGAPGVHSARFAAESGTGNASDAANNAKLLGLLANVPKEKRTARFRCVIALAAVPPMTQPPYNRLFPNPPESVMLFGGICEGRIDFEPRGTAGFGYDPLFVPDGHEQSFAQLGESVKNQISHRSQALKQIYDRLGAGAICASLKPGNPQ